MMLRNLMLTGHILSAIAWVGGGLLMQALALRARAAGPDDMYGFAQSAAWTGNRFFMPASVLTLGFGLAAAATEHGMGKDTPLWIKLALIGWFLTAVNGAVNLGRTSRKMATVARQKGPTDEATLAAARRLLAFMRIDLVIVVLVVADMVFKPS